MPDEKIYRPTEIEDTPFPQEEQIISGFPQGTSTGVVSPTEVKETRMPTRKIAVETIGSAINTMSRKITGVFEFIQQGAIQIGKYVHGVSGELKISPDGITAKNKDGNNTFAIDGTTGNATFRGSIQSESVITGIVDVGDNKIIIDGEAQRMVFYDDNGVAQIVIGEA